VLISFTVLWRTSKNVNELIDPDGIEDFGHVNENYAC